MYKLLIVEDEPIIRKGLMMYFDWAELGFHQIYEADNGSEGAQIALQECPDLIITDIRMPLMDGLEMIEHLRDELPDTLFVIWSGYNEFAYAQKALRLGNVFAYLLKPLQYQESMKTIQDCIHRLEKKRNEQEAQSHLALDAERHKYMKRSQMVQQLLEDRYISESSKQELYEEINTYIDSTEGYKLQSFVITYVPLASPSLKSRAWWRSNAERILIEVITTWTSKRTPPPVFAYLSHSKMYAFTVMNKSTDSVTLNPELHKKLEKLLHQEGSVNQIQLYLSIGPRAEDIKTLSSQLVETGKALFRRFDGSSVHIFEPVPPFPKQPLAAAPVFNENDKIKLLTCLEQNDPLQLKNFLSCMAEEMETQIRQLTEDQWLAYLQEMISAVIRFAAKYGLNIEERYHEKLLRLTFLDDFDSVTDLFDWLSAWMIQLQKDAKQSGVSEDALDVAIFGRIEDFILQHIDQEITLQMVADHFFYNPSYLSRLFKTKLNKNYMTFVTEIRIEYAKRCLLQSKILMTEVCLMCGYTSYKHFVKMFRKVTNMTPSDYRKQMGMID